MPKKPRVLNLAKISNVVSRIQTFFAIYRHFFWVAVEICVMHSRRDFRGAIPKKKKKRRRKKSQLSPSPIKFHACLCIYSLCCCAEAEGRRRKRRRRRETASNAEEDCRKEEDEMLFLPLCVRRRRRAGERKRWIGERIFYFYFIFVCGERLVFCPFFQRRILLKDLSVLRALLIILGSC